MKKYDIFISYRRTSYDTANLIATRLKAAGYRVFFDLESMRSGPFNEQLYNVIKECKDFVLILPQDALIRCVNEEDWVRKEILHAMKNKKNIIPIMLNGFTWSNPMPKGLEELCNYQAISASSIEYFDLSMQRLETYLKSRKNTKQKFFLKWFIAIIISITFVLFTLLLFFRTIAKPVCRDFANYLTYDIAVAELLIEDNKLLNSAMLNFDNDKKDEIYTQTEIVRTNIEYYQNTTLKEIQFSTWQNFLLSLYGIDTNTLVVMNESLSTMYSYIDNTIILMQHLAEKKHKLPSAVRNLEVMLEDLPRLGNIMYYTYLQTICKLPESSLEECNEVRSTFTNMPKVGLGLNEEEYEILIKQELEKIAENATSLKNNVNTAKDELYEAEIKLDSINNALLNEYRIKMSKFDLIQSDEPWKNWNRITSALSFFNSFMKIYEDAINEGDNLGSLTPELVLTDLNKLLDDYQNFHGEELIKPVKEYLKIAIDGYPLGGVIVFDFAQGYKHDVYQKGDIIIEWNNEKIIDKNDLKRAYKKSNTGKLKLLRIKESNLKELIIPIPGNEDNIVFMNLVNKE